MKCWSEILIFDETWPNYKKTGHLIVEGHPEKLMSSVSDYDIFIGVGDNRKRMEIYSEFKALGATFATLIHYSSIVSPYAQIGEGTIVMPGCVINYGTQIGNICILNSNCTVEHDCYLSNGVHISPGATLGGGVSIGESSWVGLGASVRHSIIIEEHAIVGAGSTVVKNVDKNTTVVGSPASLLRTKAQ